MKSNIPDSLKSIDVKSVLRRRGIYLQLKQNQELKEVLKPIARKALKKTALKAEERLHPAFTNEVALAYREKQLNLVNVFEKQFEETVKQFISKIEKSALDHLDSEMSKSKLLKIKSFYDDDDMQATAQLDFTPILMQEALLAGQEAYKLINHDDVYIPYKLKEKIAENVKKFTSSMLDTDRQVLTDIIAEGVENGESVPEIRDHITNVFEDIGKKQSTLVTRTEVLRVSNQASLDAFKQSGVVSGKQWLTAGATDECAAYEGEVETLDGNFYDSSEFADGDPPLHPNCRCVLLPVLVDS